MIGSDYKNWKKYMLIRQAARQRHDLRNVSFIPHVSRAADGSCVVKMGHTHVLCTAVFQQGSTIPLSVGYGILPGAIRPRRHQERNTVDQDILDTEECIHRVLSMVIDKQGLDNIGLLVDCDVLQADGALKAAAISGAFVAASLAFRKISPLNLFHRPPLIGLVTGLSCGIIKGEIIVDLDAEETEQADVVGDIIFNDDQQILDMHIAGRHFSATPPQIQKMMDIVLQEGRPLLEAQREVLTP